MIKREKSSYHKATMDKIILEKIIKEDSIKYELRSVKNSNDHFLAHMFVWLTEDQARDLAVALNTLLFEGRG